MIFIKEFQAQLDVPKRYVKASELLNFRSAIARGSSSVKAPLHYWSPSARRAKGIMTVMGSTQNSGYKSVGLDPFGYWHHNARGGLRSLVVFSMIGLLVALGLLLLIGAWVLRHLANTQASALDLDGDVIYEDARGEILASEEHGLTGCPDYILRSGEELIPVERKSRKIGAGRAYEVELLQLAAYCLLAEEKFGTRVNRGQLQ